MTLIREGIFLNPVGDCTQSRLQYTFSFRVQVFVLVIRRESRPTVAGIFRSRSLDNEKSFDRLHARQAVVLLWGTNKKPSFNGFLFVPHGGIEPPTVSLRGSCSTS